MLSVKAMRTQSGFQVNDVHLCDEKGVVVDTVTGADGKGQALAPCLQAADNTLNSEVIVRTTVNCLPFCGCLF